MIGEFIVYAGLLVFVVDVAILHVPHNRDPGTRLAQMVGRR